MTAPATLEPATPETTEDEDAPEVAPPTPPETEGRSAPRKARRPRRRRPRIDVSTWTPPVLRFRRLPVVALVTVAFAVLGFSWGWADGRLTFDGRGVGLYARVALGQWRSTGGVPYWLSSMWNGTPIWAIAPSLPTLVLVPLAAHMGPDAAVRVATVAAQIVGGWGAYVLAASLWGRRAPATLVAGLLYGLHPIFVSHGALFGHETSAWVMAATPWLAWSFRKTLRGDGAGYVVAAGLVAGFAVVHQAEHAYSLVVMCACMMGVEMARRRGRARGRDGVGGVVVRAGTAAAMGVGSIAFWLLPFLSLGKSFVLTPPESARFALTNASLGRRPGAWLTRSGGATGIPTGERLVRAFDRVDGILGGTFYLSWLCVALTLVTIVVFLRRDRDGHLTAILFASAIGVWMSTGGVALAQSQLAERHHVLALAILGVVVGFLVRAFLRRLHLRHATAAGVFTLVFLVVMPYLTPFMFLQRVVPFLSSIRFPRFYPLAVLGLALGAAYPLLFLHGWARERRRDLAPLLSVAACLAVAGLFVLDIAPYRDYYRLRPPDATGAYRRATQVLAEGGGTFRVANDAFGDARTVDELVAAGHEVSVGWPHPIASKQVWRVTGAAFATPLGFRDAALGLSGTSYITYERPGPDDALVPFVGIRSNARALPMVRAYEQVVVTDDVIAPEMAVALAQRHVGVVSGGRDEARRLEGVATSTVGPDPCDGDGGAGAAPAGSLQAAVAGEAATACTLHDWVSFGADTGLRVRNVGPGVGAVFRAGANGLAGIAAWLDRGPGPAELSLREVDDGGEVVGREVARVRASGTDDNDMAAFRFDPIPDSTGKRYAFVLSCPTCRRGEEPKLLNLDAQDGPGNFLVAERLNRDRVAAFSALYGRVPAAEPPAVDISASRTASGRWRVDVSAAKPVLVVVATADFPGWKARVDGRSARLVQADGAFLGVPVGAGRHTIALDYHEPGAVWVGRVVTLLTLVLAALMVVVSRRSRRRRSAEAPPTEPPPAEPGPRPVGTSGDGPAPEGAERAKVEGNGGVRVRARRVSEAQSADGDAAVDHTT